MPNPLEKAALWINDPWSTQGAAFADIVQETDKPTHSKLLGPDGKPLAYKRLAMGFDLRCKNG